MAILEQFQPVSSTGSKVKLSWSAIFFKMNLIWPLEFPSNSTDLILIKFLMTFSVCSYIVTLLAQYYYTIDNINDIPKVTRCCSTALVGTQTFARIMYLAYGRREMRSLIDKFYRNIYITEDEDRDIHNRIERNLNVVYVVASSFLIPLTFLFVGPFIEYAQNPDLDLDKPYIYRMKYPFDAQETCKYVLTTMAAAWVGVSCVGLMVGVDVFINSMLSYGEARYTILQEQLEDLFAKVDGTVSKKLDARTRRQLVFKGFRNKLHDIFRKQQVLDDFSMNARKFFSFPLFTIMLFQTFHLCVVAFQLAKNDFTFASVVHFSWLVSAAAELLVLGNYGQKYTDAAARMGDKYYMSGWENLLVAENGRYSKILVKDISFAIMRASKPVCLTGMEFVELSLSSIAASISSSIYLLYVFECYAGT